MKVDELIKKLQRHEPFVPDADVKIFDADSGKVQNIPGLLHDSQAGVIILQAGVIILQSDDIE